MNIIHILCLIVILSIIVLKFTLDKSQQLSSSQLAYNVATTGPTSAFAFIDSDASAPSRTPVANRTGTPGTTTSTPGTMPTTNNPQADAAVVEINRFRATFGLPPLIYDVSKNADADACAAYDAKNGYHSSLKNGLAPGCRGQCECSGSTGSRCVQLYEQEESQVQNPKSDKPICGKISCGHFCIILGSYTHMSSGTSGNFSTHNFYNGSPRCSF